MNKRRWIFSTVVTAFLLIIGGFLVYQQDTKTIHRSSGRS